MPLRQNLRPTLPDTLRKLRQDTVAGNTVAHGVKTVLPGEGLQLVSTTGAEIFWDWETAHEYDTRISEGRAAIEQARLDLDQAEADLAAGVVRLDENERILDALGPRVDTAESTVAQASRDLDALETSFGDVQAKAAAADQRATDALTKAGAAQTSADGKNSMFSSVNGPSGDGKAVGDIHRQYTSLGSGGQVSREWRWSGTTWVEQKISGGMVSNLDIGTGTVGLLNGLRIEAGTILSDRVVVSQGENLIPDPTFLNASMTEARTAGTGWKVGSRADGVRVLTTNSTTETDVCLTGSPNEWVQVDERGKYQLQLTAGGPFQLSAYLVCLFSDGTSKSVGEQPVRGLTSPPSPSVVEWDMKALGGPVAVRPYLRRNATPEGAPNYWQQVAAVSFRRKVGTVLIEDGAVTGEKIEGVTVAAKVVTSMTAEHRKLVVTEDALLAQATVLGTLTAEEINSRRLIRGRDAILDGTVDINQLNVTGPMAAAIARFMDAEARKLIVTEDAILNRATVIESLVTPALIANRVDARYVLSNEIVTGKLQVSGRLTTAPAGQPSLVMQPSQSSWNNKDLALWFTPDGNTPGFGNTDGWVAGMWMSSTPNTSTAQPLNLRGQSGAGLVVWGDSVIVRPVKGTRAYFESFGGQDFQIRSRSGEVNLSAGRNLNFQASTDLYGASGLGSEVRFHAGSGGFRITDTSGSNTWSYGRTTSQAANAHIDGNGVFYRSTSSRRYKKYISDSKIDPAGILQLRPRRWRDRKQTGIPEDMSWHYGMVAEEVAEIFPQFVPTIPDPESVDPETGIAPPDAAQVPDSIEYDRLALFIATTGYQDLAPRVAALEAGRAQDAATIASLAQRVAQLEGASS